MNKRTWTVVVLLCTLGALLLAVGEAGAQGLAVDPPPVDGAKEPWDWEEVWRVVQAVAEWCVENYDVLLLAGALVVTFIHDGWGSVRTTAIEMMLEIEKVARRAVMASGPDKMAAVVSQLLERLPPGYKQVVAMLAAMRGQTMEEFVTDICQKWFDAAVGRQS